MSTPLSSPAPVPALRDSYQQKMRAIARAFEQTADGLEAIQARSDVVDAMVIELWQAAAAISWRLASNVAIIAIGGYGRRQLFPNSDLDLLFLLDGSVPEAQVKDSIRRVCQEMWDCGIRVSPQTRTLAECERFSPENAEFTLSLLDHRFVAGDRTVHQRMANTVLPKLLQREGVAIIGRLVEMTLTRHAKYGDTLFHLEPNIKDCPGGLRDAHVCHWLQTLVAASARPQKPVSGEQHFPVSSLRSGGADGATGSHQGSSHQVSTQQGPDASERAAANDFAQAEKFLYAVRCFLHYRAGRDDNTLDWRAQDEAAARHIGKTAHSSRPIDAAFWMRLYFRHARSIDRRVAQALDEVPRGRPTLYEKLRQRTGKLADSMFAIRRSRIVLNEPGSAIQKRGAPLTLHDPAGDPEVVLRIFETMASMGCKLSRETEDRLEPALPMLSSHLEEGPALWNHLRTILTAPYAAASLRSMHALGILELMIPEFHGIDALVIRDAYHRYTVDEHTFVVIETLHGLEAATAEWEQRLAGLVKELHHPELLFLAALLHDTGKGRSTGDHAQQSAVLAQGVLARMEIDEYESSLVMHLIANHLEMSAAMRRDIFDAETVRAFAAKVGTPDQLRMLTLFTYADIKAVHPDALTPWKAENLWRLYIATANHLDRTVDEERVHVSVQEGRDPDLIHRITALMPGRVEEIRKFLEGFPQRYLRTHTPAQIAEHFRLTTEFSRQPVQLDFHHTNQISSISLVTPDREMLFANMAGSLAALGMDIVTADAYSNDQNIVVDSFRFTDRFRTLELNHSEHSRFVKAIRDVMTGITPLERLLEARARSGKRRLQKITVETRIEFDNESSSHSTLLQVIAQDVPGLLRALSITLANHGCNIEVALVDTEGETAIDVFYVTRSGRKLDENEQSLLRASLLSAIAESLA